MPLRLRRPDADVFVPDGAAVDDALERTTDLGVGAHADDLEFMCIVPIGECLGATDRWFTGVTCTDGAGSARGGRFAKCTDSEMVAVRREEQRRAASAGGFSMVMQFGHPSSHVLGGAGFDELVDEIASVLEVTRPVNVYTHSPADKHQTHLAVVAATVYAVRRLPLDDRPSRLVGIEGWRDLDWAVDGETLRFDSTRYSGLADELAAVYESQIENAKRYDVAARGRRQANATLYGPRETDAAEEVVVALDLTSLIRNDDLDPVDYVLAAIDRFRADVERSLRRWFP